MPATHHRVAHPAALAPAGRYLYFFDKGCEAVTPEVLQGLLQLIGNELTADAAKIGEVDAFHKATVQHIRTQQEKEGDLAARYAAVSV